MVYGGLDAYGFHALELLQCMVERRQNGETGIAAVHCLEGKEVWEAGKRGVWSRELAAAAEEHIEPRTPGRMEDNCENPTLFLLEYADGLRAAYTAARRNRTGLKLGPKECGGREGAGLLFPALPQLARQVDPESE